MANLDNLGFKFKIGDKCIFAGAFLPDVDKIKVSSERWLREGPPPAFFVGERIARECSGGVQLFYQGTVHNSNGGLEFLPRDIYEHDLRPYPPIVVDDGKQTK